MEKLFVLVIFWFKAVVFLFQENLVIFIATLMFIFAQIGGFLCCFILLRI